MTEKNQQPNALRRAVESPPVPAHLEFKIRAAIREAKPVQERRFSWTAMFVGTVALAAVALALMLGRTGSSPQRNHDYVVRLAHQVSSVMAVGLGDHIHCAFFRRYPDPPPTVAQMQQLLGPEYSALLGAVKANVPDEFRVCLAHKCRYQGRQFVHLVLKRDERLVSVVVATRKDGEDLSADRLLPALAHSGITFYRQHADAFQIAAFENSQHLVYLISDMPQEQNMQMLLAMAPSVEAALPGI